MKDNFYSDNMIDSFETEEEAMDFARQVTKSLEAGGFTLTAFASSSAKVLESIPTQHRSHRLIDLNLDGLQIEYLLGLEWDIATDTFGIRTKQLPSVTTKRQLSSAISLVFDPLGLCLPVITGAKLIFQKTHKDSLDDSSRRGWDSPLPEETLVKWNDWTTHFHKLSFPRIPRCFRDHTFPIHATSLRLVVYADASSVAYAAVAYLRCQFEQKVTVNFVMAKGRLAPLKPTTVPRLELRAAVLAVELSLVIKKELRLPILDVEYHSDSQIVLHQLHSNGTKQPTFVNKRREYILQHSKADSWHFVPSADNPADDSTRSTVPKDFGISCRWNSGPPKLRDPSYAPEPFIPLSVRSSEEEPSKEEDPPVVSVNQLQAVPSLSHPHADQISKLIKKADQLHLLKREVAQLLRSDAAKKEELSADELAEAFRLCLSVSQDEEFPGERKALLKKGKISSGSPLRRLCPYIDSHDGLMKVDGRLRHAELPARTRHPIIISSHHHLTRLIVEDRHVRLHHAGIEHTLSVVRQDFYLPQGRSTIRRALRQCIKCRIQHAMPQPPRMANLPKERLQGFVRVFTNAGLDCFGPFHVVIGRKTVKRYGLLVTCLASRAVHLEVLDSMDADSFIMALRRFISYRGCPKVIYSDNGTNIVAGQKELEQGIANLNSNRVVGEMVDAGIDWRKSAPSCAHEGGVWERLIGSSKVAMRAILESRSVSDEVLRTVFAEVTSLLNSRPLTHVHTDPSEPEPLTPNHFLIGGPHPHRVPDDEQSFDGVTRRRWKQAQFIVNQFWRRWMREYLPSLIERKKWEKSVRPLRVGDKVLIMDENLKRGEWLTGSITAVHPGDDGVIRKATVQTARSTLLRPAVKLCFISGDRGG
ncbi:hypothetical protein GHT06_007526 [Daphnia sinensis]|uniref:Integrase catalytic domain-containing protein n=1 Tax=Daphnia sinensis TaxID=1820382 RepID=A0AAD5PN31_9CRUS|nr:hypothetical protein GHT06_007526 [Daphnia sinensis]